MSIKEKMIQANDELFRLFVQPERWSECIERCIEKDIERGLLYKFLAPETRQALIMMIVNGEYQLTPPHDAKIPKDEPGEYRTVFVCEPLDRVILSVLYSAIMDCSAFKGMIHPSCRSYQKGMGCGKTVLEVSRIVNEKIRRNSSDEPTILGAKYDFHHYFDTVRLDVIMDIFESMERRLNCVPYTEPLINMLRAAWGTDILFTQTEDKKYEITRQYMGIRQGNAVGAFLADVVLYELDEFMSKKYEYYVRYSDDLIVIGDDPKEITEDINRIVSKYGVSLNLKKTQVLTDRKSFKFLGFMIKGTQITISPNRLKKFQKEIDDRTIRQKKSAKGNWHIADYKNAVKSVIRFLYVGDGRHSWGSQLLPIVNVESDIRAMSIFILDRLRACKTGKTTLNGIGFNNGRVEYIAKGCCGKNLEKTDKNLKDFKSLVQMWKAIRICPAVYRAEVNELMIDIA